MFRCSFVRLLMSYAKQRAAPVCARGVSARARRVQAAAAAQRRRGHAPAAGRADGQRRLASSVGDQAPAAGGARLRAAGACRQRRMRLAATAASNTAEPLTPLRRRSLPHSAEPRNDSAKSRRSRALRCRERSHNPRERKPPACTGAIDRSGCIAGYRAVRRGCCERGACAAQRRGADRESRGVGAAEGRPHLAPAFAAARCSDAARRAVRSIVRAARCAARHASRRAAEYKTGGTHPASVAGPGAAGTALLHAPGSKAPLRSGSALQRSQPAAFGPPRLRPRPRSCAAPPPTLRWAPTANPRLRPRLPLRTAARPSPSPWCGCCQCGERFLRARCAARPGARAERLCPRLQAECEKHTTHNDCWLILHEKARSGADTPRALPRHASSRRLAAPPHARADASDPPARCTT